MGFHRAVSLDPYFVIFINDMPELVKHTIKLFADDSKLVTSIRNKHDIEILQSDIDALVEWSNDWRMLFNNGKCKSMTITKSGKRNVMNYNLSMATITGKRQILQETQEEKDLGVVMSNNLKFCDQATHAANKASRALGILKRTFRTWNKEIFLTLYPTFVRPHLEYAASVW